MTHLKGRAARRAQPVAAAPAEVQSDFNPYPVNIETVKAHVTDHPGEAAAVLAREQEGQNRKSLVAWLQEFVAA